MEEVMSISDQEIEKLTKVRLHMRANPDLGKKVGEAINEIAQSALLP
jgi:hypothetical protein